MHWGLPSVPPTLHNGWRDPLFMHSHALALYIHEEYRSLFAICGCVFLSLSQWAGIYFAQRNTSTEVYRDEKNMAPVLKVTSFTAGSELLWDIIILQGVVCLHGIQPTCWRHCAFAAHNRPERKTVSWDTHWLGVNGGLHSNSGPARPVKSHAWASVSPTIEWRDWDWWPANYNTVSF